MSRGGGAEQVAAVVTRVMAESSSLDDAAPRLLRAIGERLGWDVGAIWLGDGDGQLRARHVWRAAEDIAARLMTATRELAFRRGEGLPGRVLASAAPLWIPDLFADPELQRASMAAADGLRGACAFPILSGAAVTGVIEFFSRAVRPAEPSLHDLMDDLGRLLGPFVERARAEAALRETEARLRMVISSAPVILFAMNAAGVVTLSEGRALAALGYAPGELVGRSVFELFADQPRLIANTRRALAGESFSTTDEVPTGVWLETWFAPLRDGEGAIIGTIGVSVDVTERREAERRLERAKAKLVQADRLASLGTLAAGVAHEINNPLTYVLMNLMALHRDLPLLAERVRAGVDVEPAALATKLDALAERAAEAHEGVERVARIVGDLRTFSSGGDDDRELVDVRAVIESTIGIARATLRRRGVALEREYDDDVPLVNASAPRLSQVVLNLLVNAMEAVAEVPPPRQRIRVAARRMGEARVVIEMADRGPGIPSDVLGRIFEPFFTTKPIGVGTGLGLSICHGIVSGLGGAITVESQPGEGTTFRVTLPAAPPHAGSDEKDEKSSPRRSASES